MDGCNGRQLFRYIYFPSMLPTFKMMLVLIIIQSFLQFDYVYLLTSGGPAHSTEMLGTLTYNYAFSLFQFGKSAAIAVIMSLLGLVASIEDRNEEEKEKNFCLGSSGAGTSSSDLYAAYVDGTAQ